MHLQKDDTPVPFTRTPFCYISSCSFAIAHLETIKLWKSSREDEAKGVHPARDLLDHWHQSDTRIRNARIE